MSAIITFIININAQMFYIFKNLNFIFNYLINKCTQVVYLVGLVELLQHLEFIRSIFRFQNTATHDAKKNIYNTKQNNE